MQFILFVGAGNSLADAEVKTQIPSAHSLGNLMYSFDSEDPAKAISLVSRLGSSLKLLAEVGSGDLSAQSIASHITTKNFSLCGLNHDNLPRSLEHEVKSLLPQSRFISGKDQYGLSPVIITKQKTTEIFIDESNQKLYHTIWTHDFKHWIDKDRHMPRVNARAGMLPPKIARSMINLVPLDPQGKTLLDPFCGSGRVLVEAAEMGYQVLGLDISNDQVEDTRINLKHLGVTAQVQVHDAVHASDLFHEEIDAIVTEPYLGKPNLRPDQAEYAVIGLKKLYLGALKDWHKILKPHGYVVMVFPILPGVKTEFSTSKVIDDKHLLGYNQLSKGLIYSRPEAGIKREIVILQKQ